MFGFHFVAMIDMKSLTLLRMVGVLLPCLLLLVHLMPGILASGFASQSHLCGSDYMTYMKFDADELFFLNGNQIGRDYFCNAYARLKSRHDCSFANNYCLLQPPVGRKILQQEGPEKRGNPDKDKKEDPKKPITTTTKLVLAAASGLFVVCCLFICPCLYKTKKGSEHQNISNDPISMESNSSFEVSPASSRVQAREFRVPPSPSRFSTSPKLVKLGPLHLNMSQVAKATQNFSDSLKIGEGAFGTVYKAKLEDGQVVAIKRGKKDLYENMQMEFKSEVELLSKIEHRNLVRLLGYVDKGDERLIITEYVSNGTLREHLDGRFGKILDFSRRLEISIDVAHGLTYLHRYAERQIIHRDVKASNILLTESMRGKVADFGFARVGVVDPNHTHISTKVKGTVGHLDPDYMRTNQLTHKSDVYSFGILLVEILTGRHSLEPKRVFDERVTIRWAFAKFKEGSIMELVDPLMHEVVNVKILKKMFHLAIQCAAPVRNDRPDMEAVCERLWAIRANYYKSIKKKAIAV